MLRLSLLLLLWLGGGLWERKVVAQTRKKHVLSATSEPRKLAPSSQHAAKGVVAAPPVVLPSWKMPYELVNLSELRRNAAEWERLNRSSLEFNLLYEQGKPPQLLYRHQPTDTVWFKVNLSLPVYAVGDTLNKLNWEDAMALPDTCNLDHQGAAEVRVTIVKETQGWGSHAVTSNWTCFNLIAIDQEPHLLLSGLIERWDAGWQTRERAVPGGREQSEHYLKYGWQRKVFFSPMLRLGKATRYSAGVTYEPNTLTRLRPGRYRYLHDNLVWVGQ